MVALYVDVQKALQPHPAGLAIEAHIQEGRDQSLVGLHELGVGPRHGKRTKRLSLPTSGFQRQRDRLGAQT